MLTERNVEVCQENGWNDDLARCDRILGRLALTAGDTTASGEQLAAAVEVFRDGDYLTELAATLADLAERAHAALDHTEGTDRGWAAKARALHARLAPADLDPDPLATVERLVAAQKAAEGAEEGEGKKKY